MSLEKKHVRNALRQSYSYRKDSPEVRSKFTRENHVRPPVN